MVDENKPILIDGAEIELSKAAVVEAHFVNPVFKINPDNFSICVVSCFDEETGQNKVVGRLFLDFDENKKPFVSYQGDLDSGATLLFDELSLRLSHFVEKLKFI